MDQEQAIAKAREFADTAMSTEVEKLASELQEKLAASRGRLSAQGTLMSGTAVVETAKIHSERLNDLLQRRVNLLLEGFELHHVTIDDNVRDRVIAELKSLRSTWVSKAHQAMKQDHVLRHGPIMQTHYLPLLERNVGLRENEVRTQIDRRRFMQKKNEQASITVYHVEGNNNRVLTNSEDHSVNVVTQSNDQIFAKIRQEIESKVPAGGAQSAILEKLTALEQAQNTPSFVQRYTDFIAVAANHMQLIAPFIPAMTEMLHKTL